DADGVLMRHAAREENRGRTRVLGAGIGAGCRLMSKIAHHTDTIPVLFKRAEAFGELKILSFSSGCPFVHRCAVRNIEASQTRLWDRRRVFQGRLCRNHGFQERQRNCHTGATQKCAAGKMLLRDEVHWASSAFFTLIRNGSLSMIPKTIDENL